MNIKLKAWLDPNFVVEDAVNTTATTNDEEETEIENKD